MEYLQYTVEISPDAGGGYWAEVPALPTCAVHASTLEEVTALVREVVESYISLLVSNNVRPPLERAGKRRFVMPLSISATCSYPA